MEIERPTRSKRLHLQDSRTSVTFLAMSTTPQKPVLTEAAALPVELLTALVALLVLVLAACVG